MPVTGGGIADLSHLGRREPGRRMDPLESIAADIAAIRDQHVLPPLMMITQVNLLAAGNQQVIDSQDRKVSWLICQSFTGTVNLYIGDGGGGSMPHMQFQPTTFPILIPVSVKPYKVTVIANGGPAQFTVIMVA